MKIRWIASLGLSLGILASGVRGDDGWNSPPPTRTPPAIPVPAVTLGKPIAAMAPSRPASNTPVATTASVVNLGRPVSVSGGPRPVGSQPSNAIVDPNLQRTGFDQSTDQYGGWVTRAASPDVSGPKPMPAGPRIETTTQLSNYQPLLQPDVPAAPAKELLPAPQSAAPSQQGIPAPQFPGNFDTLPPGTIISDPQMIAPEVPDGQLAIPHDGLHPQDGFPGHPPVWAPGHPQNGIIYDPCECVDGCNVDCKCDCQCDCKCGCGCYPGNRFYVSGEYLGWWTKGSQLPPLLTTATGPEAGNPALNLPARTGALGLPNTEVVYGNNNVSNDFRSGARLMAGYWFDDERLLGFEVGGFWLQPLTDSFNASSAGLPLLYRPFFDPTTGRQGVEVVASSGVPGQPSVAGGFSSVSKSEFWGAEANMRSCLLCGENFFIDGLVGVKTLGLDESLTLQENPMVTSNFLLANGNVLPAGTSFFVQDRFQTNNQFYGGQVGAIAEVRQGPWSLDLKAKLGVGTTVQSVNINGFTQVQAPGITPLAFPTGVYAGPFNSGNHNRNDFSIVPEVGLSVGYQVTQRLRAFVGYDFMYWTNVVRPGQQIDETVNPNDVARNTGTTMVGAGPQRPAFAFNTTDFWAQGIKVGLEFRY